MDIILDPSIRDWVVLPMVLVMVLIGLTRHYVQLLLQSKKAMDVTQLQQMQTVQRSQRTRKNGKFLSVSAFETRKHYFCASEKDHGVKGILREKQKSTAVNPMMNPSGMMDMMKGNMAFMIPNVLMMGLISYFFAGFVLVKVPFLLSMRFKMMLQRGIELNSLDVRYVSSLSWYFLVMFGMRGFLSLLLGEESASNDAKAMQMQMGMGAGQQMGFDGAAAFKQERDNMLLTHHVYDLENIEYKVLGEKIPVSKEASTTNGGTTAAKTSKYTKSRKRD